VTARYFGPFHPARRDRWVYGDRETGAYLHKYAWTAIVRHVPVAGRNSPDDPALARYWADRRRKRKPPHWHRPGNTPCVPNMDNARYVRNRCSTPTAYPTPPANGRPGTRHPQGDDPPGHHRTQQQPDDTPPRTRPLRPTSPRRQTARHGPVEQTPARPRGLLEPCAATSGKHGSEGGAVQQCAAPTRQQGPLDPRCHLHRRPLSDTHRQRAGGHGHPAQLRPQPPPIGWTHQHRRRLPTHQPPPHPSR
jgi:hypothetical protein